MKRSLLIFLTILFLAALPGPYGTCAAQGRVTSDTLHRLEEQAQERQEAVIRLDEAIQEAQADGEMEKADVFKQAREHARKAYLDAKAKLEATKAAKIEQDKREAALNNRP
jgi:F0F1-type ATP synthase membrane subunit b/b'